MAEKVKEQDEGTPGSIETGKPEPAGSSGYVEPRPEQKSGEGEDLGQKQTETLKNADWNRREA